MLHSGMSQQQFQHCVQQQSAGALPIVMQWLVMNVSCPAGVSAVWHTFSRKLDDPQEECTPFVTMCHHSQVASPNGHQADHS